MSLRQTPWLVALPIVLACIVGYVIFRSQAVTPQTVAVVRGSIVQEALASGNVESPTTAQLRFASPGILAHLSVHTGDRVKAGDVLAREDTSTLTAQLAQAEGSLSQQQALYQSLVDGTRPEQIAVTQAQVTADTVLRDRAVQAEIDTLNTTMTTLDAMLNTTIDPLFLNPRSQTPQFSLTVPDSSLQTSIVTERVSLGTQLQAVSQHVGTVNSASIRDVESETNSLLRSYVQLLSDMNTALAEVSASQPNSQTQIASWSSSIVAARTTVNTSISSLTSAITQRQNAAALLERDTKTLALQSATATASSLNAQHAAISQAQGAAATIASQMKNFEIIAPFDATVTDTNGTVGETVSANSTVVSLMPHTALDVTVNVSEDTVINVQLNDPVTIQLDAFPKGVYFHGTVISIDPAQTVIAGAVYYVTKVAFTDATPDIKPGMTAHVSIETASSSNALMVPASALIRSATSSTSVVRVYEKGATHDRVVTTGIESQDGRVQILSGLSEGERVVIGS